MESGVEFVAADLPQANRLTIHILAAIAEYEARLISERVKAAIAASKVRGVVWGGNRNASTGHLDEARRLGNEGRRRRAVARAIDPEPLLMDMRDNGKSLKGHRCGAKPSQNSPTPRRSKLDAKRSAMGPAVVRATVPDPQKMEPTGAEI
jgi:Resolvase, N terminal domain